MRTQELHVPAAFYLVMALMATAASSFIADRTLIWKTQAKKAIGPPELHKCSYKVVWLMYSKDIYQYLLSSFILALDLFAQVSLRNSQVFSDLTTILEQRQVAIRDANQLWIGAGFKRG